MSQDTIAAIATPPGAGGIGIIRLSGNKALSITETLTKSTLKVSSTHFRKFYDADDQQLDHGIVLFFKSPHSL